MLQSLVNHTDEVSGLDWNDDGTMLSTGDGSGKLIIWDATTWIPQKTFMMQGSVNDVHWNNAGDRLAACSSDGEISIWDAASWSYIQNLSSDGYGAESITWSPDDASLAVSSVDDRIRIWDMTSWTILENLETESTPTAVQWSPDDSYIASSKAGGIHVWNTTDWNTIDSEKLSQQTQVGALAIHPDSDRIATCNPDNTNDIVIWTKNLAPILDPIQDQLTMEDQLFEMTVGADDSDQLTFSDDSELVDIDPVTGEIAFVPTNDDVGDHIVNITVSDGKGGFDNASFNLSVINVDDPPVAVPGWRYGADF
ncbi:MAG: hypothetical protein AMK69_23300, partial [Nitrospira bacterium SG8_3]